MHHDVIIVGAGFAGMYLLHKLRTAGYTAQVLEAGDGVGGTWYWNRYPGARCDVQSIDYSFSFDPALEQQWQWSEKYATQPEILRYANHVADRYDLRRDIRFGTRVKQARFDEQRNVWHIESANGEVFTAQFYVMATGCLSVPKDIDIAGAERFCGQTYHTAHWPHEGVDFSGKRVAVIGTGSSAVQSIPLIAAEASQLTVFQRTPAFSLPAANRPLDRYEIGAIKANYREHREAARHSAFGVPMPIVTTSALEVSAEQRQRAYQAGWDGGTLNGMLQSFGDLLLNQAANDTAADFMRDKIRAIVRDPATAETLCPYDFPFGTKRPCLDTRYYETFNLPHVELVDLRKTPLTEISAAGVRTSDRERAFDAIVFATGFDAMTGALVNVDIRGVDGLALKEKWADGPRTYLGLGIAGFPNMFTITGPGSPSVMSNMMVSIEQHVDWIAACLDFMRAHGHDRIEASSDAEAAWVEHVNQVADATLFPKANSWYMGANVPGKPRVFLPYIGGVGPYRQKCDEVAQAGYAGFRFAAAAEVARSAG
ncbi:MAG: NAD(P)/FAD-dependent oxidoreductase [Gammaproteobacteria bacterium]|nr:NAD(P)/FAD-dependent oxidoreductase [Gammaproteobacteria bacterium]